MSEPGLPTGTVADGEHGGPMDNKRAHLEMIQGIIERLSSNSFLLKGWSVTLVTALFALAANDVNHRFILIAYLPAVVFWALDGYFLYQETLYRELHNTVRQTSEAKIDFSLQATAGATSPGWLSCTFSKTLLPFHGSIIATIVVVNCILA